MNFLIVDTRVLLMITNEKQFVDLLQFHGNNSLDNYTTFKNEKIDLFFDNYAEIDFRKMYNSTEMMQLTHRIHSYPAKMIQHIPFSFFSNFLLCREGGIILDPFCGSGTVLLEAKIHGIVSYGVEINPIARLITKVKTTPIESTKLKREIQKIFNKLLTFDDGIEIPVFPNIDFWFSKRVQKDLTKIKVCIDEYVHDRELKDFFYVSFSSIIREVSYADCHISPPVKSKKMREKIATGFNPDVIKIFKKRVMENAERVIKLSHHVRKDVSSEVIGSDARSIKLLDKSVDLVITSPPYISAQKYLRSTRLELFWLGLLDADEFRELDSKIIGTEKVYVKDYQTLHLTDVEILNTIIKKVFRKSKERAYIMCNYFNEMKRALGEIHRVLKPGGYFILLIGNNEVEGIKVPSHRILTEIAIGLGFSLAYYPLVNEIKSRGLMTKRNKTAGLINSEWLIIFRK